MRDERSEKKSSGEKRESYDVMLYKYDLSHGMARSMSMLLIGEQLDAIWHTSIVVYGKEFYFNGGEGIVTAAVPGSTPFGTPLAKESLGNTAKSLETFLSWVASQSTHGFGPMDYDLLRNNCNHFTQAASQFLLGKDIPEDVRNMIPRIMRTPLGKMLAPLVTQVNRNVSSILNQSSQVGTTPLNPGEALNSRNVPLNGNGETQQAGDSFSVGATGALSSKTVLTEEEEEQLSLCKLQLETCEGSDHASSDTPHFCGKVNTIETLVKIFQRIIDHPEDSKYRSVSTRSSSYVTVLQPYESYGVVELFHLAGFRLHQQNSVDPQQRWVLSEVNCSLSILERLVLDLTVLLSRLQCMQQEVGSISTCNSHSKRKACPFSKTLDKHGKNQRQPSNTVKTVEPPLFEYFSPPFPEGYIPVNIAPHCSRSSLLSICWLGDENESFFGKCYLSSSLQHLQAWAVNPRANVEITVPKEKYTVLCIRKDEASRALWMPVRAFSHEGWLQKVGKEQGSESAPGSFIFRPKPHYAIVRAFMNGEAHPGVMEPSGVCYVPFGGKAVDVTAEAHVLCDRSQVPGELLRWVEELDVGERYFYQCVEGTGIAFNSFDELCHCRAMDSVLSPESSPFIPSTPRRGRVEPKGSFRRDGTGCSSLPPRSKLLVCHDFGGGYKVGDYSVFSSSPNIVGGDLAIDKELPSLSSFLHKVYTPEYFHLLEYFVYFSHRRVSVPPTEWIQMGHRNGVAVLGTIMLEGRGPTASGEVSFLLTNPSRMARVIAALVEWRNVFGFDGYMVNWEVSISDKLVDRVLQFCKMLRLALLSPSTRLSFGGNRKDFSSPSFEQEHPVCSTLSEPTTERRDGIVLWYDAMTISGKLSFQNALTSYNKPFFDVVDGILTNYWWTPQHLKVSKEVARASNREQECFVGVDVYGRGTRFGGKFCTGDAVREITKASLSVSLFAPGWTLESASGGTREGFLQAEARFWSSIQHSFFYNQPALEIRSLPTFTCFTSGAGEVFCHNGLLVSKESSWCQVSASHLLPFFYFYSNEKEGKITCVGEFETSFFSKDNSSRVGSIISPHKIAQSSFILLPLGEITENLEEEESQGKTFVGGYQCIIQDPQKLIKCRWVYTHPYANDVEYILPVPPLNTTDSGNAAIVPTPTAISSHSDANFPTDGAVPYAWSGDRVIQLYLPPSHHIQLLYWSIPKTLFTLPIGEGESTTSPTHVYLPGVDAALFFSPQEEVKTVEDLLSMCCIALKVEYASVYVNTQENDTTHSVAPQGQELHSLRDKSRSPAEWVMASKKTIILRPENDEGWFVVRFTFSTVWELELWKRAQSVLGVSLVNTSSSQALGGISVGGIAVVPVKEEITKMDDDSNNEERTMGRRERGSKEKCEQKSPLIPSEAKLFPSPQLFPTMHPYEYVLVLPMFYETLLKLNAGGAYAPTPCGENIFDAFQVVTVFGEFLDASGTLIRSLYLGQYIIRNHVQKSSKFCGDSNCTPTASASISENAVMVSSGADLFIRVRTVKHNDAFLSVKYITRWGVF